VSSARNFALITGGGTGGHVYPALALAQALVARGHPADTIRFVGAARGLEATAVPAAGFAIDLLPGRGLRRRLTPRNLLVNVGVIGQAVLALVRALRLVGRYRPRVVVGVGGYASLPCVVAARVRRVPVVVHEQNGAPGLANRIAVRLGARPAVSLPGTPLPDAVVTGNPVRPALQHVARAPEGEPVPLLAAVGGSLGARTINEAMVGLYQRWRDRTDVAVYHVAGARNYDDLAARLTAERRAGDALRYDLVRYEDHMDRLYARTALLVSRAGGMTAEIAAAAVPSILVPLPGAPGDHQTANARTFVAAGAAVMISDSELTADRLADEAGRLLADPTRLAAMGAAARTLARPDAADRLADLVEDAAGA
jgi:undecaprenyldiphospho-muramoylpentapeptide beta-N-acetylglucosaminyltransferase